MSMRRLLRSRLGCAVVSVLALVMIGGCVVVSVGVWFYARADQSNVGELAFENRLAIPELLEPTIDEQGRKVFDLEFMAGETEFLPGKQTDTWGLNGTYLGPTLRASQGDEVLINVTNGVDETTTLHWHGMHLPAEMDGGPHQMIAPGDTWSPTWTIDQPAATLWYHPHIHGATAEHVYRGAAGMFLLDDPELQALDLPDTYGVDDIPLIVQDKNFNGDGSLNYGEKFLGSVGVLGDTILANGTYSPYFEATTELVRFRVLNASNARVYNLGFTDDREYALIGTDSGLLEQPVTLTRLQLSPGERAEIVVRVSSGDEVILRSFEPDLGLDFAGDRLDGGDDTFDILQIRAAEQLTPSARLPSELVSIDRPDEASASRTRTFELNGGSRINDQKMDMGRIDEVVTEGDTEIWEVTNGSDRYHNFHVHMVHFIVLSIDGEEPPPELSGWKDTVFVPPDSTVRFIARFEGYSDPDSPYMFHCHVLMHEDDGMMGQFVVVAPGVDPPRRIPMPSGEHHHNDSGS